MTETKIEAIEKVKNAGKVVFTSFALAISGTIQTSFGLASSDKNSITSLSILAIVLISLLVVEALSKFFESIIDRTYFLRRLILGSDFFEGVWIDTVDNKSFAIINVIYDKGYYKIHGEYYAEGVKFIGNWSSSDCLVEKGKIRYNYQGDYGPTISEVRGVAEYVFSRTHFTSIPNSFSGYFIDFIGDNKKERIQGERLSKDKLQKLNSFQGKKELISEWIQQTYTQ